MGRPQGSRACGLWSLALGAALLALPSMGAAQPVDEDALFADTTILDTSLLNKTQAFKAGEDPSKVQTRFGGSVTALGQANRRQGALPWMPSTDGSARLVGTMTLDVSLPSHERALLVGEVAHEGASDTTSFALREGFVDFEVGKVVWVRAGKQVIQWGRGLLWTPTDLVNVEGKSLVPRAGALEGTTGLRLLVPLGAQANMTGFVNLTRVTDADSLSGALRLESVVGPVEVAASGWAKPDRPHALGLDASTGVQGIDLQGGVLWISGDLLPHAQLREGKWALVTERDHPQVRASLGLGKGFAIAGVPDRLRIDFEGYWNSRGYAADFLTDQTVYNYEDPMALPLPSSLAPLAQNPLLANFLVGDTAGDASKFALKNGLYRANQFGRAYLASMVVLSQFLRQDMTLSVQGLGNVQDKSGLATVGLAWSGLHGFFAQGNGYWFWGDPRTEFALSGTGPALDLRAGVRF
ncbi:MAG: hypothetical protein RL318_2081 [Fibrobacterota bacterium]|jgi:hypothetical protein